MHKLIKERLSAMGLLGKDIRICIPGDEPPVRMIKKIGKTDFSRIGAVPEYGEEEKLNMELVLPARAGVCGVRLCIAADGSDNIFYDFGADHGYVVDTYRLELPLYELPEKLSNGLYYYHLELLLGDLVMYTESVNNADFHLSDEYPQSRFRLLVYDKGFVTPQWFRGNIMYHIFVDRFNKGSVEVPVSKTAVVDPDWENGIPQYGEYPGAFVENNIFFGGTLYGVAQKLDYLSSLGVGCIYLSPIFKAYSNHKYDTGDYMTVDEMFGSEDALKLLISEAEKRGIGIVLDGVFNHTGDDSLYFNRYGRYDSIGAYGNEDSPYRSWYCIEKDGKYKSWWGIEVLPKLDLNCRPCREYFLGKNGVLEKYFDMGIAGIRLDVADELPGSFLDELRSVVRGKKKDGLIIGEVWENAADKTAYGERRKYFRGSQLDSVMNYPAKNAIISLVRDGDTELFYNTVTELYASYPKQCSDVLMNILGTHDTDRILTVLAGDLPDGLTNHQLAVKKMTPQQRKKAVRMLKAASCIQYTLFGTPSVFYGDEAGMEGYHDPFCRLPYPWHDQNEELLSHYRTLGGIRRRENVFRSGEFAFCEVSDGYVSYRRYDENDEILVMINVSERDHDVKLFGEYTDLITGNTEKSKTRLSVMTARILKKVK